ncbi:Gfo/Idh/MocA family oxidoreductase [Halovenus rubra]|uniref:Gfo/Idh/MocA family oxidoreductase n=2 Tax=Halovenus rubra TaxID=869890 RepID=A0ACC7DWP9_9EURY|nr:Gfo/Idh/MocA family oxidoreductase [Halovenus rubra]
MSSNESITAGVIGVGAMGKHHARVYNELCGCDLVGVADADTEQAREIAGQYATDACEADKLITRADAVTIAVPTSYHYDLAKQCVDAGTHILVEKPLVEDEKKGQNLIDRADEANVTLQVGHIERFNPVTETLMDIVPDLNVISVKAERLGPQPDRTIEDSAVTDLMIHDIDVIRALLEAPVTEVLATGNAGGRYATATVEFKSGVIGRLTASRVTQRKVRELTITAEECYVTVDYIDQTVQIHRQSVPEYIAEDGGVRYKHESIVENPAVDTGEPLKNELESFIESVRTGHDPRVTGEDGLKSLKLVKEINRKAFGSPYKHVEVLHD